MRPMHSSQPRCSRASLVVCLALTLGPVAAGSTTLRGRLYDGMTNIPIAEGYVFALAQDGHTILACATTPRGRDAGRWEISNLPSTGKAILVGFHPAVPLNIDVEEVALGTDRDLGGQFTSMAIPPQGASASSEMLVCGWCELLNLAGWIAKASTMELARKQAVDLTEHLLAYARASNCQPTDNSDTGAQTLRKLVVVQASAKYTSQQIGTTTDGSQCAGDPSYATDGNLRTCYSSRVRLGEDSDQWWQADLGGPRRLTQVRVYWQPVSPYWKEIDLRGSLDGKSFTSLIAASRVSVDGSWTEFPVSGKYRFLRVYLVGSATPNHGLDLAEFEVSGYDR